MKYFQTVIFLILLCIFLLTGCNSGEAVEISLDTKDAAGLAEFDYSAEMLVLTGLQNVFDTEREKDFPVMDAPPLSSMFCIEKSISYQDWDYQVYYFYDREEKCLQAVEANAYTREYALERQFVFYFKDAKVYIETKDGEYYCIAGGEIYSLDSTEKAKEAESTFLTALIAVLTEGNFGRYDVGLYAESYWNPDFLEAPYADFYFYVVETKEYPGENTVILSEKIDSGVVGSLSLVGSLEGRDTPVENTFMAYQNWYAGGGMDYHLTYDRTSNSVAVWVRFISDGNVPAEDSTSAFLPVAAVNLENPSVLAPLVIDEKYIAALLALSTVESRILIGFDEDDKEPGVFVPGDATPLGRYRLDQMDLYVYGPEEGMFSSINYYAAPNSAEDITCLSGVEIGAAFETIIKKMGYGTVENQTLTYDIGELRYMFTASTSENIADGLYISYIDPGKRRTDYFSAYKPVVVNGILVGGYYDGRWLDSDTVFSLIYDKERYEVYGNSGKEEGDWSDGVRMGTKIPSSAEGGAVFGNRVDLDMFTTVQNSTLDFSNDFILGISGGNYFDNGGDFVQPLSPENEVCRQIVAEMAADFGYPGLNLEIVDIYRVDIDKDGTDEVLINANTGWITDVDGEQFGALVFMRKIVDGEIKNIMLEQNFFTVGEGFNVMLTYRVLCFYDINDDGVMEVIVKTNGYDHLGYSVYELQGDTFRCVLSEAALSA